MAVRPAPSTPSAPPCKGLDRAAGRTIRTIDPLPRPGKATGAYAAGGAYDVHPYVLLNHNDAYPSHERRGQGQPLSGAALTQMYCTLMKHYHGEAQGVMVVDPLYCNEWAYVPHFYFGFYVWQYASSIAGAAQFVQAIESGSADVGRERFLGMLEAGGCAHPYELYRRAGVDLGQPAPYQALFQRMERVMDRIEALLGEPR